MTFSLRLFLLNHSPVYTWTQLPKEARELFAAPNGSLVRAEFFMADAERRRFRFELWQRVGIELQPLAERRRHKADIVVLQDWELVTLISLSSRPGRSPRSTSVRAGTIESAAYVARSKDGR